MSVRNHPEDESTDRTVDMPPMPRGWKEGTWGDLVTLEYGKGLRSHEYRPGPYPVFGTNGPIGTHDEALCHHAGVIVGRKGAYRGIHYCDRPFYVIDTAFYVQPKVELDLRWAYYALLTYDINAMDSGSAIPSTSRGAFYALPIRVPPLPEQRAIAHVLGTLDDKIALNRSTNETLEAMARALFKSWFVDFDPVRAKAEGRDPGLPPDLAALFPDGFEDSELGEIPRGWEVGTLADYAELNPESWSESSAPGSIEYLDLSNVKWGRIEGVQRYLRKDAPSRARRVLKPGDTIIGTVRPGNGSYALIQQSSLTGSTGFAVLRPFEASYTEFVYFTATAPSNIERLSHLADGAAYPAVRPNVVLNTTSVRPGGALIQFFATTVKLLMARIVANERESRSLEGLRDALLPRMLSGTVHP